MPRFTTRPGPASLLRLERLDDRLVPAPCHPAILSIGNASVVERDSGAREAVFTVSLRFHNVTTTVDYATADGTATLADNDYRSTSGTLTFRRGENTKRIRVPVTGDHNLEADETFVVNLTGASGGTYRCGISIRDRQGLGTIRNDDGAMSPMNGPAGVLSLAIGDASGLEGNLTSRMLSFPVTLSAPSDEPVRVRYSTTDGSATEHHDYRPERGTLIFAPGETEKTIDVRVRGDLGDEGNESFSVELSDARGAAVADGRAAGTILDDDPHYLVDDFTDGDDAGWTRIDFTGGATFDASSGAYQLRTAGPLPPDDPTVGTMAATWDGSADDEVFGNGVVAGTVRANTAGTTAGFYLRGNTTPDEDHDYGFYGSSSLGTFYIERFDITTGGQTILAMADPSQHPFVAGVDYRIEGGVWGDWIWLRAWEVGEPRPALPQLVVRDTTFGPEDGLLLGAIAFFDPAAVSAPIQVDATFDDITFRPLPGPLPWDR
jgi:hypothetical protein